MSLISMFKEEVKKQKKAHLGEESRTPLAFPTGLDLLDFKNGKLVIPGGEHKKYLSTGVTEGTYVMWIGASGSGKTTVALQSAFNIIRPYEQGTIFHYDLENATDKTRVAKVSNQPMEYINEHYFHKNTGISSESFYESIYTLHSLKTGENRSNFEVNTGKYDERGDEIVILAPTVVILDSLPLLVPQKITEEEELSGQMSRTSAAKMNAQVFRQITALLREANIILYVINHITQKIEINPMVHTKPQVNFLKQGEELPGGRTPTYLANNIFRLDPGPKLTEDKELGINGFMNKITLIKSRSARAGQELDFVFNPEIGFDNVLTNYVYMKKEGLVGGAGRSFYLTTMPEVKFSQKEVKNKYLENVEFRKTFIQTVRKDLRKFINTSSITTDKSEDPDAGSGDDVVIEKAEQMPEHDTTKKVKAKK